MFDIKKETQVFFQTGTTNWQRYFAALLHPSREPESFGIDEIFKVLPRYKAHNEINQVSLYTKDQF